MVVTWLKYDWKNRSAHTTSLLQKVRLGLIPEESLTKLLDAEILEIPECKDLLQQVLDGKQMKCSKLERLKQLPNLFATRSTTTVSRFHIQSLMIEINKEII